MNEAIHGIKQQLAAVPLGQVVIEKHQIADKKPFLTDHNLQAAVDDLGKGKILTYELWPGVELSFRTYQAKQLFFCHNHLEQKIIEINHCRLGRIGWNMQNGGALYLGEGDMSLHDMNSCKHSQIAFPSDYYQGLYLSIDVKKADQVMETLMPDGACWRQVYEKYCRLSQNKATTFLRTARIENLFEVLYEVPEELMLPYARLKLQELLLYLLYAPDKPLLVNQYSASQVDTVKKVHDKLVDNLNKHYTIAALANEFLLNQTTLKAAFKRVYGQPIASHLRKHRMEYAKKILAETNKPLAQIAQEIGYASQSKFSQSFKQTYGQTPSSYRLLLRKEEQNA